MTRTVHVQISGTVQGVGYRAFVERAASESGLSGWVRNRRDGSVEAVFSGEEETVAAMLTACRLGPRHSRVMTVDVADIESVAAGPFRILADG